MRHEAFFHALKGGDGEAVAAGLQEHPEWATAPSDPRWAPHGLRGWTPLHVVAWHGHADVAGLLLDAGAEIDARNCDGRTPLHDAIESGSVAVVDLLLDRGAELDVCSAAILGHLDRLKELLDADPALARDRSTGLEPICWAAYGNQAETARELLARGAAPDQGELFCAASCGHAEVADVLLAHGADPNATEGESRSTPLHVAVAMRFTCDSSAFVRLLVEAGAEVNARNASGQTPLQLALEGAEGEGSVHPLAAPAECKAFDRVVDILRGHGALET